jgi:peroxiredoxin
MKNIITLCLIIIMAFNPCPASAKVFTPSYQEKLEQMMKARKGKMSDEDMAVMKSAADYLNKVLPNPGIKVGEKAPDFTLTNAFGKQVSLTSALQKGPVVLVFYRGSWCPYCNLHLALLKESLPELNKRNAQLMTITPQTPDKSLAQFKDDGGLFEVLSDLDNQVMKNYNLYFDLPEDLLALYKKFGIDLESFNGTGRTGLPVPGSFVIDQNGMVVATFADNDYKLRMEPQDMIDALDKIKK